MSRIIVVQVVLSFCVMRALCGIEENEEALIALAIRNSPRAYMDEKKKTELEEPEKAIWGFEPPEDERRNKEATPPDSPYCKSHGRFFFSGESLGEDGNSQWEKTLKRSDPVFHGALITLEGLLKNLNHSVNIADLQENILCFEQAYQNFFCSDLYNQMVCDEHFIPKLHKRVKPILEHPMILLKQPPTSWQSIMTLVGILNGYRKKALAGSRYQRSRLDDNNGVISTIKQLGSYLDKTKDSSQVIYHNIERHREILASTFEVMSSDLKQWYPADYPEVLDELDECFKEHGCIIRNAELSIDPEFALAKSLLKQVVVSDIVTTKLDFYRKLLIDKATSIQNWPREKVIEVADLVLGAAGGVKKITEYFNNQLSIEGPENLRKSVAIVKSDQENSALGRVNHFREHSKNPCSVDFTGLPVSVDENGFVSIGRNLVIRSQFTGLLALRELNLPYLLGLPSSTWKVNLKYKMRHVKKQLSLGKKEEGYLCVNPAKEALARQVVKLPGNTILPKPVEQIGMASPAKKTSSFQLPWKKG